jgi:pSer/pThr/pTyr-binding forkhead associated (FHA) protein
MALVTIRILDGPDRGKEFDQVAAPVTVGREEGNLIQLNDQRVSRNHLKIHESGDAVLLTDLQSTNGTKVNGESVHVWQLQPGDLITAGRSMLVFGSTSEISERLAMLKKADLSSAVPMGTDGDELEFLNKALNGTVIEDWTQSSRLLAKAIFDNLDSTAVLPLQLLSPPSPPRDLPPQQAAQMEAFLQYLHLRLRHLIATVRSTPMSPNDVPTNARITLSAPQWQNIIDLHARITNLMGNPAQESVH